MENKTAKACHENYIRRIEIVQDYIEEHMEEELKIVTLAKVAGFSEYHFSRIFVGVLGENIAQYVKRIRMEKSLFYLAHRNELSVIQISFKVGYQDSNVFTRAFKAYFGISPTKYRKEYSKNCKEPIYLSDYSKSRPEQNDRGYPVRGLVRVEDLPEQKVIYTRHMGDYKSLAIQFPFLLKKLLVFAKKEQLLNQRSNQILVMYHENPEFTDSDKFRTSICLRVPDASVISGNDKIGEMAIPKGKYAIGYFKISQEEFPDAWNFMYKEWLFGSGYIPRNEIPFEVYLNDPSKDKENKIEVEICVPVKSL